MAENETLIQLPPLSRQAVEMLVRMWGIALAALHRNAKVVAAATVELTVYGAIQQKIAAAAGTKHPFDEIGDMLAPYLGEMLVEVKDELRQQGKDPDKILRDGRKHFGLPEDDLPPFEEDGEINFN